MPFGLLSTGFVPKQLADVRSDLDAAMRAAFGQSLALGDKSSAGIIDGIMAERYAELWALAQAVYNSQNPDAATGSALDALCTLTGTIRPPATHSLVTETLTGTPSTVIPSGSIIATFSTGARFQTDTTVTLASRSAWTSGTPYTVGTRVTNAGNVYQCIIAGVSNGGGGPTTALASITDGSVTWTFLGIGTADSDVAAISVDTGAIVAVARDLTNVAITPVAGWSGAINLLDAAPGRSVATDAELRLLRESELAGSGTGTADAIRAAILKLSGVTSCDVFHNDTDTTDANGVPPHAIEALVNGGADQDIINTLFAEVAAGIATYASPTGSPVTGTATDSQGVAHTISFSRPTLIPIYVSVTLTFNASMYPADGDAEVQLAIAEAGALYTTDLDVFAPKVSSAVYTVPGILNIVTLFIGTAPSPGSSATISITSRQLAVFDTTRVTVSSSPDTP